MNNRESKGIVPTICALPANNDYFEKLPDPLVAPSFAPILDLFGLCKLSQTKRRLHTLFKQEVKQRVMLKKLLHLVVKCEITWEEKIKEKLEEKDEKINILEKPEVSPTLKKIIASTFSLNLTDEVSIDKIIQAGINPIVIAADMLLQEDPSCALKREYIADHVGHVYYESPLESAYRTYFPVMCDLIFEHAKRMTNGEGETQAIEQLNQIDLKSYNYDLVLLRLDEITTAPKKTPALIKQYNETRNTFKILQWGNVNGEWELTKLSKEDQALFNDIEFPQTHNSEPMLLKHDDKQIDSVLKQKIYDALKKGHTAAHFGFGEYLQVMGDFLQVNDTSGANDTPRYYKYIDTEWYKVGKAQRKFPAWLASLWCAGPFDLEPENFSQAILRTMVPVLKLDTEEAFYIRDLGVNFSIYKGPSDWAEPLREGLMGMDVSLDLDNMTPLCQDITQKFEEFKQSLDRNEILQSGRVHI